MNLVLIEENDFTGPHRIELTERRARHIIKVLRAQAGDRIKIGLLNGQIGEAQICGVGNLWVDLEIEFTGPPPAPLPVTLLLALPRPKVCKRVLSAAVTMGVKQIFIFNSWRVDKSYWQTPLLQANSLNEISRLALEQAVDTQLPEISLKPLFRPFAEDEVPDLAKSCDRAWLLHPGSDQNAKVKSSVAASSSTLIAIGPEGGFIPFEVEMLTAAGLKQLSLGPRILRVEQAVPAALAFFYKN